MNLRRSSTTCHGYCVQLHWLGDTLPKAKPTQVIVHRIELQEKEREMLEPLIQAKAINNLIMPVAAGSAVYVGYKIGHAAFGWTEDLFDGIRERMTKQKASGYKDKEEGGYDNIFGLPGWGIIPGVL